MTNGLMWFMIYVLFKSNLLGPDDGASQLRVRIGERELGPGRWVVFVVVVVVAADMSAAMGTRFSHGTDAAECCRILNSRQLSNTYHGRHQDQAADPNAEANYLGSPKTTESLCINRVTDR